MLRLAPALIVRCHHNLLRLTVMDLVQTDNRWADLHATMLNYLQEYVGRIRRIGEVDDIENGVVTLATVL